MCILNRQTSNKRLVAKTSWIINWVLNAPLYFQMYRNSHLKMLFKISVLEKFTIFIGKNLRWRLFLVKFQAFRLATILNRDSNTGVFL